MNKYVISMILFIVILFGATSVGASSLSEVDAFRLDDQASLGSSSTDTPTAETSEYTKLILDHTA